MRKNLLTRKSAVSIIGAALFFVSAQLAFAQLTSTNGPGGGSIWSFLIARDGRIYAGTDAHGVYVSTDDGQSWSAANKGLENVQVQSIAATKNGIFAASSQQNDRVRIYRSSNGGTSWTLCTAGATDTMGVSSIAASGDTVFAGLWGQYAGQKYGILFSTDNGDNWERLDSNFTSVVLSLLYMNGKLFVGTADSGLYVTGDLGKTWTNSSQGLYYYSQYHFYANIYDIREIGKDLFIAAGVKGVYKSTDGGDSWSPVAGTFTDHGMVTSIAGDGANLYAGSGNTFTGVGIGGTGFWNGIISSTDAGSSWSLLNSVLSSDNVHSVAVDSGVVLAGTGYGVDRSTDGGRSWNYDETGLPASTTPAALLYSNGILFAALKDGGVSLSTDRGESWQTRNSGLEGVINPSGAIGGKSLPPVNRMCVSSSGQIVAATGSGLYKYESQVQVWSKVGTVSEDSDFTSLFGTPAGIFANSSSGGIYRSTDNGSDWQLAGKGFPAIASITSIVGTNGILLATSNGVLYESTDGGLDWSPVSTKLKEILAIAALDNIIYASTYTYYSPPGLGIPAYPVGAGIYMSTDVGKTWTPVNSGLPFVHYFPELTSFYERNNVLFAAGQGVYSLNSSGTGWIAIDSSLNSSEVNCLVSDGNYLYAGISGRGVLRENIADLAINEGGRNRPGGYYLYQNYPNPFNPSTIISYGIGNPSHVALIVYDVLGRKVETLVNNDKQPGHYQITFDGSRLPSGVYFCRLQAGSYVVTKKMLLLK